MAKKKSVTKKIITKKGCCKNLKYCSDNPNFLVILLASTIIVFSFLFRFL